MVGMSILDLGNYVICTLIPVYLSAFKPHLLLFQAIVYFDVCHPQKGVLFFVDLDVRASREGTNLFYVFVELHDTLYVFVSMTY